MKVHPQSLLSAKSSKTNNPFLFKSSCAVLCLRDIRYNKEIFIWWCSAKIVFHLSSSSYDGKLFSRFERIISKLFRLRPQLANRPPGKRFVGRLWSSFVFRIIFPEYRREHPVGCSHLKIPTASSCPIQSTSDIPWCLRLTNWTLGSAAARAVCPLNRKLCIHRAYPSNFSSLFRFLFVLLVLPELDHDDCGSIHLHRGILTISDHRYRRQSLSHHFYQLVN